MAKTTPLNMRATPEQVALLTKAAAAVDLDRSAFILETACREAQNVLLDQRFFMLDDAAFSKFQAALQTEIPTPEALKASVKKGLPWDK